MHAEPSTEAREENHNYRKSADKDLSLVAKMFRTPGFKFAPLAAAGLILAGCSPGQQAPLKESANTYRFPEGNFPQLLANFVRTNETERVVVVSPGRRCSYGHVLNYVVFVAAKDSPNGETAEPKMTFGVNYHGNGVISFNGNQSLRSANLANFVAANPKLITRSVVENGYSGGSGQTVMLIGE